MSRRLRSKRSVRRYAASTLCASADSTTSRGWSVSSAAQSRNERPEPVGHCPDFELTEQSAKLLVEDRLPGAGGKHQRAAAPELPRLPKYVQGAATKRHPMLPSHLHPRGGNRPHSRPLIDLGPFGQAHLAPPRRGQHQELKRQLQHQGRRRFPAGADGHHHLVMRQRPQVLRYVMLGSQDRADTVAWVVGPVFHCHRPLHDRPKPPT